MATDASLSGASEALDLLVDATATLSLGATHRAKGDVPMRKYKFGYLSCEDAPKWAGHEGAWIQGLGLDKDSSLTVFNCFHSEFPSESDIDSFNAFVISGSHYSVYEPHEWITELKGVLRNIVENHPKVRLLGGCFGHQILAEALGGKAGKNPSGKFVLTAENVEATSSLLARPDFRAAVSAEGLAGGALKEKEGEGKAEASGEGDGKVSLCVLQSHGDCVLELPPGATLLASSSTATTEIWALRDQVLAWQSHPELEPADVLAKIFPAITGAGRVVGEEAQASEKAIKTSPLDSKVLLKMAAEFIRGR